MPSYTVPQSPPPLSSVNTYNVWPGGAFPRNQLIPTSGGRRRTGLSRKANRKVSRKGRKGRKVSRKRTRKGRK